MAASRGTAGGASPARIGQRATAPARTSPATSATTSSRRTWRRGVRSRCGRRSAWSRRLLVMSSRPGRGGRPLLRDAYERAMAVADEVFILTEEAQREIIAGVLPEVDPVHMIMEPVARGTTNAYGLAALTLVEHNPDAVMLTLPADHVVRGKTQVARAVRTAVRAAAETESIVAVGLKPTYPSTGLGYVHAPRRGPAGTYRVARFVEKPDLATARRFLKSGGYYWKLAWVSWVLPGFVEEPERSAPRHVQGLRQVGEATDAGHLQA